MKKKANIETVVSKIKAGEVEIAAKNLAFNKISSYSRHFQINYGSNYVMYKLFGF